MKILWKLLYGLFRYEATSISENIRIFCTRRLIKSCGRDLRIGRGVMLRGWENMEVGDNVNLNDNVYINAIGGLKIGNGVRIAPNVTIVTESHVYKDKNVPIFKQGLVYKPIEIEDDVWLCTGVVVPYGRTIGKGCIIGANAVVTENTKSFGIYAGSPLKLIKRRK